MLLYLNGRLKRRSPSCPKSHLISAGSFFHVSLLNFVSSILSSIISAYSAFFKNSEWRPLNVSHCSLYSLIFLSSLATNLFSSSSLTYPVFAPLFALPDSLPLGPSKALPLFLILSEKSFNSISLALTLSNNLLASV